MFDPCGVMNVCNYVRRIFFDVTNLILKTFIKDGIKLMYCTQNIKYIFHVSLNGTVLNIFQRSYFIISISGN